jgi:LPLT family lysophospholipid transporter-like MFS transporter
MIGAVLAGRLHRVGDLRGARPYGWALALLIGLLGLVEVLMDIGAIQSQIKTALMLVASGAVAGVFLIPLNAALQSESDPARLGKTVAAMNFVDNLAMVFAGGFLLFAARAGIGASTVFLLLGAGLALCVTFLKMPRKPLDAEASPDPEI